LLWEEGLLEVLPHQAPLEVRKIENWAIKLLSTVGEELRRYEVAKLAWGVSKNTDADVDDLREAGKLGMDDAATTREHAYEGIAHEWEECQQVHWKELHQI
jgi:hypothetical protein